MKKLLLAAVLFTTVFASCKKESCPAPVPPVNMAGTTWNGTISFPGLALNNLPLVLIFNADGTMAGSVTNGSSYAIAGTWNLVPNSSTVRMFFTIVSVSGNYTAQATLTTNNTKLESGSGTNTTATYNCTFTATKQ
jgi:hypothetical protein